MCPHSPSAPCGPISPPPSAAPPRASTSSSPWPAGPQAQLAPLDDQAPDLDRLIASGAVVPPRRTGAWRPPAAVPVRTGVRIDRALVELRGLTP